MDRGLCYTTTKETLMAEKFKPLDVRALCANCPSRGSGHCPDLVACATAAATPQQLTTPQSSLPSKQK